MARTTQDLRNRAAGVAESTKSMWKSEPVFDQKLVARVRSKMGRFVSHPHAVHVEANNGNVTLSGAILAHEAGKFLKCVKGIPGVQNVEDRLDVHGDSGSNPNLQGDSSRDRRELGFHEQELVSCDSFDRERGRGRLVVIRREIAKPNREMRPRRVGLGLLTRGITNREMTEMKEMTITSAVGSRMTKPGGRFRPTPRLLISPCSYDATALLSTGSATADSLKLYPKPRTDRIRAGFVGSVSVFCRSRRM